MRKDKLLMVIILVLVLLNTTTLVIMWVNKPPFPPHRPKHERPDKIIIKRLELDEAQQKQFDKLKKAHRSQIVKLEQQSRELHQKYFALLEEDEVNDSIADAYEKQLATVTERKEEITFSHFRDLKNICKPEQIELFNNFIGELSKLLARPHRPKH